MVLRRDPITGLYDPYEESIASGRAWTYTCCMRMCTMSATLWLAVWMSIGLQAQPATSSVYDTAREVATKAVATANTCAATLLACTSPCAMAADTPACVAQCPNCSSELQAADAALDLVRRMSSSLLGVKTLAPSPSLSDHVAEGAHAAAEAFHIGTGIAEMLGKEIPIGVELVGWGGLLLFSPDLYPSVPSTTSSAVPALDKYNPAWYSPPPDKIAAPPLFGVRLNPSPSGEPFLDVKPGDGGVIVEPSEASPGSAIFKPAGRTGTVTFKSPDQPGMAVFQAHTGANASAQSPGEWQGGIAVFSPLQPIPVPDDVSLQYDYVQPVEEKGPSAWRLLLQGFLQQTPAISQAIWGSKQPAALSQRAPAALRPLVTSGAKTSSTIAPTVPSVSMCLNPAAVANTHNVTQNGSYVTGPNAPGNSYNQLYIPCSQVKK